MIPRIHSQGLYDCIIPHSGSRKHNLFYDCFSSSIPNVQLQTFPSHLGTTNRVCTDQMSLSETVVIRNLCNVSGWMKLLFLDFKLRIRRSTSKQVHSQSFASPLHLHSNCAPIIFLTPPPISLITPIICNYGGWSRCLGMSIPIVVNQSLNSCLGYR